MAKNSGKNRTHIRPHRRLEMESDVVPREPGLAARSRNTCVIVCSLAMLPLFLWAYAPTWHGLMETWDRESDYSHGWLVVPLTVLFLWLRRASFPTRHLAPSAMGLVVLGLSVALRWVAARFFVEPIDGWSLILWIAGWFWLIGGYRLFQWMAPALAFLLFMVPLPYRFESMLSVPLQGIATQLSCFFLQVLGQPAFAEGTTILLGDQPLRVEQQCSGLRIFIGIFALAYATLMLSEREWWERILLLFAVVPIALFANATRIVVTGLLYRYVSSDAARHFSHDIAGWLMIVFAALLFVGALWYLSRLAPEQEVAPLVRSRRRSIAR